MAGPAWLADLSEDWEEPEPVVAGADNSPSRVPSALYNSQKKRPQLGLEHDGSGVALSERSFSQINIPLNTRRHSKLSQTQTQTHPESQPPNPRATRSASSGSTGSTGSVVHNTCHRNENASPSKGDTPEWKRRLLQGRLAAGEQPDLFTSATTGLEAMFQPPPAPAHEPGYEDQHQPQYAPHQNDTTMPSSPPAFAVDPEESRDGDDYDVEDSPSVIRQRTRSASHSKAVKHRTIDLEEPSRNTDDFIIREDTSVAQETAEPSTFSEIPLSALSRIPTSSSTGVSSHAVAPATHPAVAAAAVDPSRQVSSQSVVHNEDLSPIIMSPQKDQNGRVTFAPVTELPASQLRSKLEKLRQNQAILDSNLEDKDQYQEGTEELVRLDGFINCQRGGRSAEGSFRHRLLSPCDTSDMLPEDSLQASTPKQFPSVSSRQDASWPTRSPVVPAAPFPSPEKASRRSPLRNLAVSSESGFEQPRLSSLRIPSLSHNHHRVISAEIEAALNSNSDSSEPQTPSYHGGRQRPLRRQQQQQQTQQYYQEDPSYASDLPLTQFGSGKLNGYEFHEEVSIQAAHDENDQNEDDSPIYQPDQSDQPHRATIKFDLSALSKYDFSVTSPAECPGLLVRATPKKYDSGSESKRPHSSPSKNPTPKRRRTLHETDVAFGFDQDEETIDPVHESHQRMQAAIGGRRRKDARQSEVIQRADPHVLASRHILRPRNPTPRTSQLRESQAMADLPVDGITDDESRLGDHSAVSDTSASFAAPPGRTPRSAARKPSIKTQDFLDEAEKIMAMIRNKARPTGLASVEESEAENSQFTQEDQQQQQMSEEEEDSFEASSVEPLSRPPSREGRPLPYMTTRQDDPELAQRLKKYEEGSDMGEIISSSLRSLGMARDAVATVAQVEQQVNEAINNRASTRAAAPLPSGPEDIIASDPPNICLTSNPHPQETGTGADMHTAGSQSSIPTTSSKGSESCKNIPPHNVSHLIPDQVGNMILDRDQHIWVKRKKPALPVARPRNILPSEDNSEDDPFASIPDLTVDITMEMRNLRLSTATNTAAGADRPVVYHETPSPTRKAGTVSSLKSSMKKPIGRSPLHQAQYSDGLGGALPRNPNETLLENDKEVEHEITIHEDRINSSPPRKKNLTISFSSPIASIIKDVVHAEEGESQEADESDKSPEGSPPNAFSHNLGSLKRGMFGSLPTRTKPNGTPVPNGSLRSVSRRVSLAGHSFIPRPISRIEEREEDSPSPNKSSSNVWDDSPLVPTGKSNTQEQPEMETTVGDESALVPLEKPDANNVSLLVTPAPNRAVECAVPAEAAPVISQCIGTLSLSPLSEITFNHGDQSMGLEVSYLVGDHRLVTGDGSKKVMSVSVKDLVNRIAEVVPFEPDWEVLRELVLSSKRLTTLHKLDQFCSGLVTLDASDNALSQLNGVPGSIRNFKVTHNRLTELTGWGHLMNLQYLDVSNNELKSLAALRGLVHLRNVRADNNQIASLDDLLFHDGIQALRARGNMIQDLDFEGTSLRRLTELDLEGNGIRRVRCIEALTGLGSLNLQRNAIAEFKVSSGKSFPSLKYLKLTENEIVSLDISRLPGLRLLHVDRNHVTNITGFSRARHLDSLSLREQRSGTLDMSFLDQCYEVRKLFLSGNLLPSFSPSIDMLNLQFLEVANCGISSLPRHLGHMTPNLRVLNANFNAIEDLRPLSDVPRLKKLMMVGNRVGLDVERVLGPLGSFVHLALLDLRGNGVGVGFYGPQIPATTTTSSAVARRGSGNTLQGDDEMDVVKMEPFSLPPADEEQDDKFASRMDLETRMRRRLYEILVLSACGRLKMLDGLRVKRGVLDRRDEVWEGLRGRGLVGAGGVEGILDGEVEEIRMGDGVCGGGGLQMVPAVNGVKRKCR